MHKITVCLSASFWAECARERKKKKQVDTFSSLCSLQKPKEIHMRFEWIRGKKKWKEWDFKSRSDHTFFPVLLENLLKMCYSGKQDIVPMNYSLSGCLWILFLIILTIKRGEGGGQISACSFLNQFLWPVSPQAGGDFP